jgi:hypothetical protein
MPGHGRSQNGVASLAYVPGIPMALPVWIGMAGTSRSSPAMTNGRSGL